MSGPSDIPKKPIILVRKIGRTTVTPLMVYVRVREGDGDKSTDPWTWDWSKVDFSAVVPEGASVLANVYGGVDPDDERRVVTFRPRTPYAFDH